jgi:hypothetical protein
LSISIKRTALRANQLEDSPVESDTIHPVHHRSSKKSNLDSSIPVESSPSSKKRGRKKRRKRKTMELVPIIEPLHPLKVKIVERIKSPEYSSWSRPNGVELLVQAAELASRQNPTPPPEGDKLEVPNATKCPPPPPLLPISDPVISSNSDGDSVNNNSKPTAPEIPKVIEQDSPQLTVVVAEDDVEDEGKLMIVDEVNLNGSNSNGRDSGMDNDEEEEEDDSAGALDLSSKSTRTCPPEESSVKSPREPSPKPPASPQFVQQRSTALHSITDSLAQRQHQRLIQQQQNHHRHHHHHHRRLPTPIHHPEAMRNLVTLSQTASLVPPHPQQVATQRLIVASYMHQFAAAAAARAASAPLRPPKPPQPSLSLSHGLLRRPF